VNWDAFQREALAEMGFVAYRGIAPDGADADAGAPRDPLSLAVLRAAARTPDAADAARLCRDAGVPARLRDPAAKRALWPRLRALRRPMQ
jgi:hypothetical protein